MNDTEKVSVDVKERSEKYVNNPDPPLDEMFHPGSNVIVVTDPEDENHVEVTSTDPILSEVDQSREAKEQEM